MNHIARWTLILLLLLTPGLAHAQSAWRAALPGWEYLWPRDHYPHPEFKTEWWYFTGQLKTAEGGRFGYQLTFFRQGIRPPAARGTTRSALIVDDLPFAHFALTDVGTGRFRFAQKLTRGSLGSAGFGTAGRLAWIDDWTLALTPDGEGFILQASEGDAALRLTLNNPGRRWTPHGLGGVSAKAAGEGRASHYYSGTRLTGSGTLTAGGRDVAVTSESWFDHEWATNQLTPEQVGWNWLSLQLGDGSALMLYQMRLRDGGIDPFSSGTFVDPAGKATHLARDAYELVPEETWRSPETKATYPIEWRVRVPRLGLNLRVTTPVRKQELVLQPVSYWEGLVDASGEREGKPVAAHGYLEMTGYAGALVGLSAQPVK